MGTGLKVALIAGIILGGWLPCTGAWRISGRRCRFLAERTTLAEYRFFRGISGLALGVRRMETASMIGSDIRNPKKSAARADLGNADGDCDLCARQRAYLYVLSAPEVAASQRVAADMMRRVAGPSGAEWSASRPSFRCWRR